MSNYPNMSYCMSSNTLLALRQVITAMQEEGPQFLRELSGDERWAYTRLFEVCEEFLTVYEELEDEVEAE